MCSTTTDMTRTIASMPLMADCKTQCRDLGLTESQLQRLTALGETFLDPRIGTICKCGELKSEVFIVCQFWTCETEAKRSPETQGPSILLVRKLQDQTRETITMGWVASPLLPGQHRKLERENWDKVYHLYETPASPSPTDGCCTTLTTTERRDATTPPACNTL